MLCICTRPRVSPPRYQLRDSNLQIKGSHFRRCVTLITGEHVAEIQTVQDVFNLCLRGERGLLVSVELLLGHQASCTSSA